MLLAIIVIYLQIGSTDIPTALSHAFPKLAERKGENRTDLPVRSRVSLPRAAVR
jgi:hypothetical protein